MSILITCPQCRNPLRVREEHAGQSVQCPRCAALVAVPGLPGYGEEIPEVLPVRPAAGGARKSPPLAKEARRPESPPGDDECPDCGGPVPEDANRCPGCGAWLDDEEDDLPVRHAGFKPCPRCGSRGARRVSWTAWGSFYGPALFHHVRCPECGLGYNGRSGGSNLLPAIVFVTVPATLILLILAAVGYIIVTTTKL